MKITNSMKLKLLEKFLESNSAFEGVLDDRGKVDYTIIGTLVDDDVPLERYASAYKNARDNGMFVDKWLLAHTVATRHREKMDYFFMHEDEIINQYEERKLHDVRL